MTRFLKKNSSGKGSSRRFAVCFRPLAVDDNLVREAESCGREPLISLVDKVFCASSSKRESRDVCERGKSEPRRFSRVFKAILFETSLAKKIRKTKGARTSSGFKNNPRAESKETPVVEDAREEGTTKGMEEPAVVANESAALASSSVGALQGNQWQGLSLVLVSLLILIVWGKVCAIFCTAIWGFLVPYWVDHREVVQDKRVIIQGPLDPQRSSFA